MDITLKAVIIYRSEEPDGFYPVGYKMTKNYTFNLPVVPCLINIKNDAISYIPFNDSSNIVYSHYHDLYTVTWLYHKGVERYYHGDASEIMMKVILNEFEPVGWSWKRLKGRGYKL